VPRPANAFLCFRSKFVRENKELHGGSQGQRNLSRMAGERWNALGDEERRPFQAEANSRRADYHRLHPGSEF
ncbi:hypothetical protein C8R46DRAFT_822093, partial [Mycena filopes]